MAKEILHYFGFYNWTCEALITKIDGLLGEEVNLRLNSPGGDLFSAVGVYAKIAEHGDITMKVDGVAASAGFFATLYPKKVECLDVSRFMVHRADMYVSDPQQQLLLNDINKDHRKKLEARVSDQVFKEVTGITIADLFNPENRQDIWIDAKGMKKLGLVQKVNTLKPAEQKAMAEAMMEWSFEAPKASGNPSPHSKLITTKQNTEDMTLEKLKAEFPAVFAAIIAEGETKGIKKENDRVMAWLAFASIDPKKVAEGISKGEDLGQRAMAEFQATAMSADYLSKIAKDSAKAVTTTASGKAEESGKKEEDKNLEAVSAEIDGILGLKKKGAAAVAA